MVFMGEKIQLEELQQHVHSRIICNGHVILYSKIIVRGVHKLRNANLKDFDPLSPL